VPGQPLIIRADFCGTGIGGVILQRNPKSGEPRPILYASRKLSRAEQNYATTEGECLAIVFVFDRAREYILPSTVVTVITDHSNLRFLKNSVNPRVYRWLVVSSEFDFDAQYMPGGTNVLAGALSRLVAAEVPIALAGEAGDDGVELPLVAHQDLQELLRSMKINIVDGRKVLSARPPAESVDRVWALAHSDPLAGHWGVERTMAIVDSAVVWPGMREDLEARTRCCPACQKVRAHLPTPSIPLLNLPEAPF